MSSLEWINKQIAYVNDVIEVNQIRLDENQLFEFLKEHYQAYHKELVELLQTHQQIKTILEAWEVIKKYVKEISINGIVFEHIINVSHTKQNYEIIKKALEVKDE